MTIALERLILDTGQHAPGGYCLCLLEACAAFAGEPHTNRPRCVDPVLTEIGISFNDHLDDLWRQELVPLIPRMVQTGGDQLTALRSMATVRWGVSALGSYMFEQLGDREHSRRMAKLVASITLDPRADGWDLAAELLELGRHNADWHYGQWTDRGQPALVAKYGDAHTVFDELLRAVSEIVDWRPDGSIERSANRVAIAIGSTLWVDLMPLQGMMVNFFSSIITPEAAR